MNINYSHIPSSVSKTMSTYERRKADFYTNRVENAWGGKFILDGHIPGENAIVLISNDYLSLANHPQILKAQSEALLEHGNGLLMSAVFLRGENPQSNFEQRMARYLQAENAVLCQSGWCANVGLLQSIADDNTFVYIDSAAHMSLWEGIKSAGAKTQLFRHNNMNHLERQIQKYGRGIIVVDSIYSTNGSICPLAEVVEIGTRHDCVIVVDESHSLGTHGPQGAGLVVELGLTDKVHFRTASLAKAFAGRAGIITCSNRFHAFYTYNSLPMIFSSALLLHEIVALQKTLDIIIDTDERRAALHRNAAYLRAGLDALGYNVEASQSQIIALEAGPELQTIKLRDALEERDVFGAVFCAPATAKNSSLIRLSTHATLTPAQLQVILDVCADIREEVELEKWPSTRYKEKEIW